MVDTNFPLWLRLNHYVNFLFITMLMRSGIQILAERPKLYWNDGCVAGSEWLKFSKAGTSKSETSGQADDYRLEMNSLIAMPGGLTETGLVLGRNWHFLTVTFWITNGLIYVILLFATNEWKRLIPTSWEIVPKAWENFLQYASFQLPTPSPGALYDPLQQLAYATVVFIMAPLSILTGAAMSQAFAARYPWYSRFFGGRQAARSIHFLLLIGYAAFLVVHVSLVAINDFAGCMNRITLGTNSHSGKGIVVGLVAILFVVALHALATRWSLKSPLAADRIIGQWPRHFMRLAYGQQSLEKEATVLIEEAENDARLRQKILKMLTEDGLKTMLEPFPENDVQFEAIRRELRELGTDDLEQKLVISGFAAYPINDQRCFECMYYLVNRRWCDIPELELPVEGEWWCRLWRI